ncbi:MAG: hypothetical protein BIFFINMI_02638 [Phycisphaerae bacterium]|nr:hypothetical protein [Phycisphaerae bacterium]
MNPDLNPDPPTRYAARVSAEFPALPRNVCCGCARNRDDEADDAPPWPGLEVHARPHRTVPFRDLLFRRGIWAAASLLAPVAILLALDREEPAAMLILFAFGIVTACYLVLAVASFIDRHNNPSVSLPFCPACRWRMDAEPGWQPVLYGRRTPGWYELLCENEPFAWRVEALNSEELARIDREPAGCTGATPETTRTVAPPARNG